ncbi:hypothetical protein H6A12_07235 [Phocea massiliensis]|uniref:Uncharacterized protein n=1 Tax=Merdimmobilis hominis TaxID=2897707 RepID=A0A938X568_9FIRM|nr:hypothetical protein [Merdimmobilis hominis]MBM6920942.1 hypothetical protein [Merdimmobilis hominis]
MKKQQSYDCTNEINMQSNSDSSAYTRKSAKNSTKKQAQMKQRQSSMQNKMNTPSVHD